MRIIKQKLGSSDLKVSNICIGTMTFGEQTKKQESFKILDFAYKNGINFVDTAEMYPVYPKKETQGLSEKIIGEWVHKNKIRSKIIIATKICSRNQDGIGATKLKWIRGGGNNLKYNKKNLVKAVEDSLKRLKTDYIDLYQLHWPERNVPIFGKLNFEYKLKENYWTPFLDIIQNIESLIKEGKIRYFGLSNETPWGITKFINLAETNNLPKPITIQNGYNLLNRVFDISNSEVSLREKCGLLAYSPLAGGRLTGKYLNGKRPKYARYSMWPGRFSRHHTPRGEEAIKKYLKIAKKYKISLTTLANSFVLSRPFLSSSILGASKFYQLKKNLNSINYKLSKNALKEIEIIHNQDPNPCV